MPGTDNVTYLDQNPSSGTARHTLARRLHGQFKDLTLKHMPGILQGMFDNADDALFKIAENANKGAEKNFYLDSMRIVRLQRDSFEKGFFDQIAKEFDHYIDNVAKHKIETPTEAKIDYDNLELVSEDDLEITIATERLVQKIQAQYVSDLSAINKRMAFVFNVDTIDEDKIPFGAKMLVEAYASAAEKIDLPLEVRIILLKLFDLQCINGLARLYQNINQQFIEADVLPVIKTTFNSGSSPTAVTGTPPGVNPLDPNTDVWGALQGLLGQRPMNGNGGVNGGFSGATGGGFPGGMTGGGVPGTGGMSVGPASHGGGATYQPGMGQAGGATGQVMVIPSAEMLSSLTNLQKGFESGVLPEGGALAVGSYVREQLQTTNTDGSPAREIKPLDNDLIDVVCLIFEYILDDPQLPSSARASIARLQIPMLKVAMLDKEFFSMNGHPARDLLNKLAQSALGIDETTDSDNPILAKINEITETILHEFADDIELFSLLDEDFTDFLIHYQEQESNALSDIEKRLKEREELALARAWVRETLESHLLGRELPAVVADIILGPWKDVMLHTYLTEGENSALWKTQIRFIDVLCWSIEPKQKSVDRTKLGKIIQHLIVTLRQGLVQIDYPQPEIDAVFSYLEPFHIASVRGQEYSNAGLAEADNTAVNDTSESDGTNVQDLEPVLADKVILEDIVLESWEPAHDPLFDSVDDEYLELARHMEMGKWVEFKNEDGKSKRAKLAWKSDLLGEFTFLNWKFDVIADKKLGELAEDLRKGNAKIIDDVPLMDRALSAVLTSLTPKAS